MRIWIIAVIFIFLMPFSYGKSETVILDKGDSFVIENVNVTLIDYNKKKEKLLVCVDNQRAILSDDKRINSVYFEIKSFRDNGVRIQLETDCDDCAISDNSECFPARNLTNLTNLTKEESDFEIEEKFGDENETIGTDGIDEIKEQMEKSSYHGIIKRIVTAVLSWFR